MKMRFFATLSALFTVIYKAKHISLTDFYTHPFQIHCRMERIAYLCSIQVLVDQVLNSFCRRQPKLSETWYLVTLKTQKLTNSKT